MPPTIGVSSCLVGRRVRYDGGHRRNDVVMDVLAPHVRFVTVCPEVELGLGTPRETLRLVRSRDDVRLIMATGEDHTDGMRRYADARVGQLADEDLDGFILKKDSPSCGLERVNVYENGVARPNGRGVFADVLVRRFPWMPVEDEGRLADMCLREHFIERVFAYRRVKTLFVGRWTIGSLTEFHTDHKLVLLAHSTEGYRALGRLVAEGKSRVRRELRDEYIRGFMTTLGRVPTPARHANVLMHMVGYLRGSVTQDEREELIASIHAYRTGVVPLTAPLTLTKHHAWRTGDQYLMRQVYLDPQPRELMLRNHV